MSPSLNRIGWVVLTVGLVWTLVYHLALAVTTLPPIFDFLGNLGHLLAFAGIVIVILTLLRQHPAP